MLETNGLKAGKGGGGVDEIGTCWAMDEEENCENPDGVETRETTEGTEACRVMVASCCEILASIATDCCCKYADCHW